jgi:error-prone DNA polymerase
MTAFAEIAATTNFSFLRGASHPSEMVESAAKLDYAAIGIADRNSLAGVVRAYAAWREIQGPKPRLLVGARLVFADGTPDIVAYPSNRAAYGRLCRLISTGKLRAAKGECILTFEDLLAWQQGLLLVVMAPQSERLSQEPEHKRAWNTATAGSPSYTWQARASADLLSLLVEQASGRVWLGISMPLHGDDECRLSHWQGVAKAAGVKLIATNDPLYHVPERRPLQRGSC